MSMISNDWLTELGAEFRKPYYAKLYQFIKEEYNQYQVFPPADDIFNAFHYTPLSQVKVGETARVVKLHGEGALKRRIMDMGITKGVELYIRKVAPLGDPMEIAVRGYELSLRRADAEMVEVE